MNISRTPIALPINGFIVGLDASTPRLSIAIATIQGGNIKLTAMSLREGQTPASKHLLNDLNHLLLDDTFRELPALAIGVTHGPGVFTGLRVGLAVAKTLACEWDLELYTYSSLEIAALRTGYSGIICSLLDARRGEVYAGIYEVHNHEAKILREDCVESIESTLAALKAFSAEPIMFTGNGSTLYRDTIYNTIKENILWTEAPWNGPAGDIIALKTAQALLHGTHGKDPISIEPIYLRASDAEIRRNQQQ